MSTKKNTCVICLEALLTAPQDDHGDDSSNNDVKMCDFGACAPCGHPIHESCFRQWAAFQNNDTSKTNKKIPVIPCPTCHKATTSFVKIYLHAEDEDAVNSSSDDDEEEDCKDRTSKRTRLPASAEVPSLEDATAQSFGAAGILDPSADATLSKHSDSTRCPKPTPSQAAISKDSRKRNRQQRDSRQEQRYKKQWLGKCEEVKILKLEAENRKNCHHDDLVNLERSQMTNFRLSKELERTIEAARFRRNLLSFACFTAGWIMSRKLMMDGEGDELM